MSTGGARRLAARGAALAAATLAALPAAAQQQPPRFAERVEVVRVVLETRVVDARGEPVTGLGVTDFAVTVGGLPVPLEAAAWVGTAWDREAAAAALLAGEEPPPATPRPGRLFVLLYQLGWDRTRLIGQVRMGQHIGAFLDTLGPEDRVAVAVFGSQLKLALDFTADRDAIDDAVRVTALHSEIAPPRRGGSPSLLRTIDWGAARAAAAPEVALLVLARALLPIPGPKTVLWIGWGLGLSHLDELAEARQTLARAHASVFTLDVTEADYHSLEGGLQQVADATGGTYTKTHVFPALALERLERTLSGHYELVFPVPDELATGVWEIAVRLTKARAQVLHNDLLEIRR